MKVFGRVVLAQMMPDGLAPLDAEVCWLDRESDWSFVSDWKRTGRSLKSPAARDALEYSGLGSKRWGFLHDQGLTVSNLRSLKSPGEPGHAVKEVGFALAVTAAAKVTGFGFLRRSWANRLILEFLAGSPASLGGIKGTGAALMHAFCYIGWKIDAAELWGEATETSCGFYSTLKSRIHGSQILPASHGRQPPGDIADRFVFDSAEIASFGQGGPVKFVR